VDGTHAAEPRRQPPKAVVDPLASYEPEQASKETTERSVQEGGTPRARRSKRRRVTTPPPAGSDPHPTAEPERHASHENDERLKGDKPPHWG